MCRCGVSGWNATVIDPFPIDAGRCRKTGHLCLQGGFIWSEGWWINQSQTILWNWEEQLRKNRHFVETNWIPAPINTNLMFFMQKKTSSWDYIMLIPLNHFPNLKKKTKKQNKQKTPQPKPNPFFKTPKNHRKSLGFFLFERTSWSVERLRSATPWPFRCTGHPRVSHKHPRPWYVSCWSVRNHVVVVGGGGGGGGFLEGVEMQQLS